MNGSGCEKCPVQNCDTRTYRGSRCAELRARHDLGDPKTNYDHIMSMNVEQLALFITEYAFCNFGCAEGERLENEPLLKGERCDERCSEHCEEWLKARFCT